MQQDKCILCNTTCQRTKVSLSDVAYYDCPNCGAYGITDYATDKLSSDTSFKLSCLIKERALKKLEKVIITDDSTGNFIHGEPKLTIESLLNGFPSKAVEVLDRVLINLGVSVELPSDHIWLHENSRAMMFSRNMDDVDYYLKQLAELDFIPAMVVVPGRMQIKAKGWDRIAKLTSSEITSNQAFVAMWFDKSRDVFYEKGIKPAVEFDGKTKCLRIDKSDHNNKICDQIIAEIRKCKYLIADFTENRGGVYFEAGFALGLKKPVIWIAHRTWEKEIHFDTRQYNHIFYDNENDLFDQLRNRIEATIPR